MWRNDYILRFTAADEFECAGIDRDERHIRLFKLVIPVFMGNEQDSVFV